MKFKINKDVLLENLNNNTMFKKDKVVQWKCNECGYIYEGESAPEVCPACLHPQGYYVATVPTGWAFEIPHECRLFILSRSGHGFKNNTTLANSVGLLDYDYRGQLMVKLICFDNTPPEILEGQAVAQCALIHTPRCYFMESDNLSITDRGDNGFGSTTKSGN